MKLFINGTWVPAGEATISVRDISVLRGFGIFDFLRTYGKNPFRLEDHIDRFFYSASLMGMKPRYSKEEMSSILYEGIEINGFKNTFIKFIQTGGVSPDGFLPAQNQTFFAYFYEADEVPLNYYDTGIKVATSQVMRQIPEVKTTNYAASIIEVQRVLKEGSQDFIHTDADGNMYEGTRSNFFGIKNGALITAESGILKGVTRKVVLELAAKLMISVEYRFINTSEINKLEEAFITNSSMEVVPVVNVDGHTIGSGKPGPLTQQFLEEYRKQTESL